jgi:hypothetical protein
MDKSIAPEHAFLVKTPTDITTFMAISLNIRHVQNTKNQQYFLESFWLTYNRKAYINFTGKGRFIKLNFKGKREREPI